MPGPRLERRAAARAIGLRAGEARTDHRAQRSPYTAIRPIVTVSRRESPVAWQGSPAYTRGERRSRQPSSLPPRPRVQLRIVSHGTQVEPDGYYHPYRTAGHCIYNETTGRKAVWPEKIRIGKAL